LNATDPNVAEFGFLAGPTALGPAAGHGPSYWILVENGQKIYGSWWRQGPKLLSPGGAGPDLCWVMVESCWVLVWWEAGPNRALGHGGRHDSKLLGPSVVGGRA